MNPANSRLPLASLSEILKTGRLYLTGARGSGKTTVGRLLAASLGYGFCDLDHYLCQKDGRSVADIVAQEGWSEFRTLESAMLRDASRGSNLVFATGGGVILDPKNRAFLMSAGIVCWLKAPARILSARLAKNPLGRQRPGLTNLGMLAEISQILAEREPLYGQCCHHIIDSAQDAGDVCTAILKALGLNG